MYCEQVIPQTGISSGRVRTHLCFASLCIAIHHTSSLTYCFRQHSAAQVNTHDFFPEAGSSILVLITAVAPHELPTVTTHTVTLSVSTL